jgi:hypothetical protein
MMVEIEGITFGKPLENFILKDLPAKNLNFFLNISENPPTT